MAEPITSLTFRACKNCDMQSLQNLVSKLYLEDSNVSHVQPNVQVSCQELAAKPDKGQVVIFDADGHVAGYAILIFFWSNEYGGDIIEIDELYVDEIYRRSGVATKFFEWLADAFGEKCAGLSLQVSEQNQKALSFYQKLGFEHSRNQHLIKVHTN